MPLNQPLASADLIQRQVERILASAQFSKSERMSRLLRYVVENSIAGRAENLKEYAIGLDVFDKDPSFDPRIDANVRTEARRLRAKLSEYYESEGAEDRLRIDLPKGAYAPLFEMRPAPSHEFKPAPGRARFSRWRTPALTAAVLFCCAAILAGWKYSRRGAPQQPRSIAVLPFVNLSPDKSNDYFSDGLTEELINALGRADGLRVVARTSAFQFKGKAADIREIGRRLNVGMLLEGSVQKEGNRIRISAHLTSTTNGYQLWSRTWDRELTDVFAIQEEIAESVATSVSAPSRNPRGVELIRTATDNMEAYNLYLLGRYYVNQQTESGVTRAIEYFQQAIKQDPQYAVAYTGLADAYGSLPSWSNTRPRFWYEKSKQAALKSLSLDDSLAEAHTSLGLNLHHLDYDWEGAEREFRRAIQINTSYSLAHAYYGHALRDRGLFHAAVDEMKRARESEPASLVTKASYSVLLYMSGDESEALREARQVMQMNPAVIFPYRLLGAIYARQRSYVQAINILQAGLRLKEDSFCLGRLGYAYAQAGRREEALALIRRMRSEHERHYMSPYNIALVYLGLGDLEQAYLWLDKAYDDRDPNIFMLKIEPLWQNQRNDARFLTLLTRMRLKS